MTKKLFRSIEHLLSSLEATTDAEEMLSRILHRLVGTYSEAHGIESGRLYREREHDYLLIESIGEFGRTIAGKTISKSYPIIRQIERERLVQISPETPGFDPELEAQFSHLDNAAILVGEQPNYILSLSIRHSGSREDLLIMLQTIRTLIGIKLRQNILQDQLHRARDIQMSLLPRRLPQMAGYELAALTVPAEEVGGDVYDVQRLGSESLALMVADASGHGLPAALQARDVVVGLRMGMAKEEKITAITERLNRVIHRASLASRFISVFLGELERAGDIFYVNCGHCPPLLLRDDGTTAELASTGPVLGPLPAAHFRRGYATLAPGDMLVIFSDGVTERKAPPPGDDTAEFGLARLTRVCREQSGRSARAICQAVIEAVQEFGGGLPWEDDVTVMVVRRRPERPQRPAVGTGESGPSRGSESDEPSGSSR
jgi:serine phosphatase RsbU (regulator of sigma subunit)